MRRLEIINKYGDTLERYVIFSLGSLAVAPLQQATRTIPIVFVNVTDPVGAGFVQNMAHPGGNITGFSISKIA